MTKVALFAPKGTSAACGHATAASGAVARFAAALLAAGLAAALAAVSVSASVAVPQAFAAGGAYTAGSLQTQAAAPDYDISWYVGHESNAKYQIDGYLQLQGLSHLVNGTAKTAKGEAIPHVTFEDKTVELVEGKKIAFNQGDSIDPIGTPDCPFEGTFDGNRGGIAGATGASIQNLKINATRLDYLGLFGYAGEHATIQNLFLAGGDNVIEVSNAAAGKTINNVGSIAGYLGGSLQNCSSTVSVSVTNNGTVPSKKGTTPQELCIITNVGGLVGSVGGNLEDCHYAGADLSIVSKSGVTENVPYIAGFIGGLAGFQGIPDNAAHVTLTSNCSNASSLTFSVTGRAAPDRFGNASNAKCAMVGGLVGYSMGNFQDCSNTATIMTGVLDSKGNPTSQIGASTCGGIVGSLRGPTIVEAASSTGVVGSDSTDPGYDVWKKADGASQPATLTIERCENTGYVVGLASVGGIAGSTGAFTRIVGCVNSGMIDGTRATKPCPAGIVGITNGDIAYCASTGRVRTTTGSGYYASGVAGLLTTYNTSNTPANQLMDAPELYGCYVTAQIVSSSDVGYRSAVLAGESDGRIHDNCYTSNLTTNKGISAQHKAVLAYISDQGQVTAEHADEVRDLLNRINTLDNLTGTKQFALEADGSDFKLAGTTASLASLKQHCTRSLTVETDQDRGTQDRNYELTMGELRSSMALAYLNRAAGLAGDWSDSAYYFKKNADASGYPLVSWQKGGIEGQVDLATVSGLKVELAQDGNPQYSASHTPVPTLDVSINGEKLYQNADYRVIPQEGATEVNAPDGYYTATIQGINAYKGNPTQEVKYQVVKCDISSCKVTATSKVFNWKQQAPEKVYVIDDSSATIEADKAGEDGTSEFTWETLAGDPKDAKLKDGKYYDYVNVHSASYQYDIKVTARSTSAHYTGETVQPAFHIRWAQLVYSTDKAEGETREETAKYDKVVYEGQEWDYLQAVKTKGLVKIKYTGKAITPTIKNATYLDKPLRDGTGKKYWLDPLNYDFRYVYGNPNPDPTNVQSFDCINVTGSDETKLACMAVRFTQGGNFDNYSNVFFEITPASIESDAALSGIAASYAYTGSALSPKPTLTYNGLTLKEGTDYTLSYKNNVNLGTATVTVTGKGNFEGSVQKTFAITQGDVSHAAVAVPAVTYTGAALTPAPTVKVGSRTLKAGTDYTVAYKNNVNAGTATVTVTGKGSYKGFTSKTFAIQAMKLSGAKVGAAGVTYNGKAQRPAPTVKVGSRTLKAGTDYTVAYKNNVNAGKATVTVTGKGNYTGSASATFAIAKAKQALTVTAKKPAVKLSKVKKKAQTVTALQVKAAQGKLTYKKASNTKAIKKFKVNAKGKVIVPKGTKKGTYSLKVKVTAAGNANYLSATKTVTVKVKVKK